MGESSDIGTIVWDGHAKARCKNDQSCLICAFSKKKQRMRGLCILRCTCCTKATGQLHLVTPY